jgi:hypothetical protein
MSSIETSKSKYRYNADPRLTANQLSEYLKASPTRRKQIIKGAKFPKAAIVAQYKIARDSLSKFICDSARDHTILVSAHEKLLEREAKTNATDWVKDDSRRSIEAIQAFQKNANAMGIQKLDCKSIATSQPNLQIAGVDISVTLDATTHRLNKGEDMVGGVIFLFSKADDATAKARQERCKIAAVLALLFTQKHLLYSGKADHKLCYSIDVLAGRAHQAPATYKTILDHINDSCEEVALRWPGIAPPEDYDGPDWH